MKVGIISRILESSLSALSCFHWSVNCVHRRPGPFGNLTSASLPSCLVTPATITTTTMPVPSTGSNPCRCQCCVWTPPTTSSPRPTVSSLAQFLCWIVFLSCSLVVYIPSAAVLCSYSSGGCEAESQPGPSHHLSRWPHWLPGGHVASPEHLHGSGLQAVCQGSHWTREPTRGPLLIRKKSWARIPVVRIPHFWALLFLKLSFYLVTPYLCVPASIPSIFICDSSCFSPLWPSFPPFPLSFDVFHPSFSLPSLPDPIHTISFPLLTFFILTLHSLLFSPATSKKKALILFSEPHLRLNSASN